MPLVYIPKSLASEVASRAINGIYICAYEAGPITAPDPAASTPSSVKMTNHWVLHLADADRHSICLDPSPNHPNLTLDLIISSQDHPHSPDTVKTVHLTPSTNLTVGHVIDHLTSAGFDKYTFAAGGQGCRFWITNLIDLLGTAGYITSKEEMDEAKEALGVVWEDQERRLDDARQTGMARGKF